MSKELQIFNKFEAQLQEFTNRYNNVVYNMDIPKENKQARSDQRKIGSIVVKLITTKKETKAPLAKELKKIDEVSNKLEKSFRDVQAKIKTQIVEYETKIKEQAEKLKAKLDEITQYEIMFPLINSSKDLYELATKLSNIQIDKSYEHLQEEAKARKSITLGRMKQKYTELQNIEAAERKKEKLHQEHIKKEQQKQKEAEYAAIAKEAKIEAERKAQQKIEQAKLEAEKIKLANEQALLDAKVAKEKAEAALILARENAKIEADQAVQEAKRKIAAQERKKQQNKEAEEARLQAIADTEENIKKVDEGILECLLSNGIGFNKSTIVLELLKDNQIANVIIKY